MVMFTEREMRLRARKGKVCTLPYKTRYVEAINAALSAALMVRDVDLPTALRMNVLMEGNILPYLTEEDLKNENVVKHKNYYALLKKAMELRELAQQLHPKELSPKRGG